MYSYLVSKIAGTQEVPKSFLTSINKDTKKIETEVVNMNNDNKESDFYTMMIDVEELHDNLKPYLNNLNVTVNPPTVMTLKTNKLETYNVCMNLYNIVQPVVLEVNNNLVSADLKDKSTNEKLDYYIQDNKIVLNLKEENIEITGTICISV